MKQHREKEIRMADTTIFLNGYALNPRFFDERQRDVFSIRRRLE